MRTRLGLGLVLISSFLTPRVSLAAPVTAEQRDEAEKHFFKATDLYQDKDYKNAALEFRKAYEVAPNFVVLFNLGQACYEGADWACALDAFQRYLSEGGTKVPAKRRADVEKDVKKLSGRVGTLQITTNVPNAAISVDDEPRGVVPLAALTLNQGKHKIVATKEGYDAATESIELAGGDTKDVALTLKETPRAPPPPPPPPAALHKSPLPFIGVGVTGALAVGAVITGVVALDASDKANNRLATFGANPAEIKRLESDASTFALVTDILAGAAIAVGVTTVVLFVTQGKTPAEQPKATFFFGPTGAGLRGAF